MYRPLTRYVRADFNRAGKFVLYYIADLALFGIQDFDWLS